MVLPGMDTARTTTAATTPPVNNTTTTMQDTRMDNRHNPTTIRAITSLVIRPLLRTGIKLGPVVSIRKA
jgi:hypothetical protein